MADIALTAAQIEVLIPENAEIYDFVAAVAITKGQAVYLTSAGTVGLADANDSGKEQFRGIALKAAGAGQGVSVLKRGYVAGFTVSGLAYDALLYLSNTAGALADAAGTMTVRCGRVISLSNKPTYTKVVYIDADWRSNWS